jgi:hypothetical protein
MADLAPSPVPVHVSMELCADGKVGIGLDVVGGGAPPAAGPPMGLEGATPSPEMGAMQMPSDVGGEMGGGGPFGFENGDGLGGVGSVGMMGGGGGDGGMMQPPGGGGGAPPPGGGFGPPGGGLAPVRGAKKKHDDALRFAASAASAQGSLPALFREGSLSVLRPSREPSRKASTAQNAFLEVFPRASARKPALLVQLESLLAEKLRLTEKLAEVSTRPGRRGHDGGGGEMNEYGEPEGGDRGGYDPNGTLTLEAYRQTFEAFINAFSTYRPLLTRVKDHYDRALDQALRSEHENVHLRSELAAMERRRQKAVELARAETNAAAASLRGEIVERLQEAEERAAAAEAAAAEARGEAEKLRAQLAETAAKYESTLGVNKALKQDMLNEASWGEKPAAERILGMSLGPVPKVGLYTLHAFHP